MVRLAVIVLAGASAGCAVFQPARPEGPATAAAFEATFPTLRDLGVEVYFSDRDCEYFVDRRGSFASAPNDEWCRVFNSARYGANPPISTAFDEIAHHDLEKLKAAFRSAGVPLDYLNLGFTIGIDEGGNAFGYDYCHSFFYRTEPGEDDAETVTIPISADWHMLDFCP